jgi:hypothetical protein
MLRSLALFILSSAVPSLPAAEPLHTAIDRIVAGQAAKDGIPLAPKADDAEFLRRVSFDLAGTIPNSERTRAFLAGKSPDKRAKLIDELLAAPAYAPAMADRFHAILMERLGDHAEWRKYLLASFAANKPWNTLVKEILRADAKAENAKGASFFLSKRLENYGQQAVEYSALTRDVGRLFLGVNLQCCECHDHLTVPDYKQQDFQGLHAFFRNLSRVSEADTAVAEKPVTEKFKFASVFTLMDSATGPALPFGKMIEIPAFPKGQEFAEPPDRKTNNPGVPKFSTLKAASEALPRAENRNFVRNGVNRLWFVLLGRGLVHPLDFHHSGNPASHPELLDLLEKEFVAHAFDIRWLFREILLSDTYQRSSLLPAGAKAPPAKFFAVGLEKRLSPEQLFAASTTATGTKATDPVKAKFLKAYANQPREPEEEVEASLKAALFLSHDAAVQDMLQPKPGNLIERLGKLADDKAFAEELYLSVLTWMPSADDAATVAKILAKPKQSREAAARKLAWALIASVEFGVNH